MNVGAVWRAAAGRTSERADLSESAERLLASLAAACSAQPFVGPNQAALEQMLSQMTGDK